MGLQTPKDPENDPQALRKRIEELEKTVSMQERLISVLREMPGCRDAKIPMETPEERVTQEGIKLNAAKPSTQKTKGPIPTGARHEALSGGNETGTEDSAKRSRPGS